MSKINKNYQRYNSEAKAKSCPHSYSSTQQVLRCIDHADERPFSSNGRKNLTFYGHFFLDTGHILHLAYI